MKTQLLLIISAALIVAVAGCSPTESESQVDAIGLQETKEDSSDAEALRAIYFEALRTANFELCSNISVKPMQQDCYMLTILENDYADKCSFLEAEYHKICTIIYINRSAICDDPDKKEGFSYNCMFKDSEYLRLAMLHGLFK